MVLYGFIQFLYRFYIVLYRFNIGWKRAKAFEINKLHETSIRNWKMFNLGLFSNAVYTVPIFLPHRSVAEVSTKKSWHMHSSLATISNFDQPSAAHLSPYCMKIIVLLRTSIEIRSIKCCPSEPVLYENQWIAKDIYQISINQVCPIWARIIWKSLNR